MIWSQYQNVKGKIACSMYHLFFMRCLRPGWGRPSWGRSERLPPDPAPLSGRPGSLSWWPQRSQGSCQCGRSPCHGQSHHHRHRQTCRLSSMTWRMTKTVIDSLMDAFAVWCKTCHIPFVFFWSGFGTSLQLSASSRTPSLSSSSSHSSPRPSLSVSSWELFMTSGQLSLVFWWPSPSLEQRGHILKALSNDFCVLIHYVVWCVECKNPYLSIFVSHESPTRSSSTSDCNLT